MTDATSPDEVFGTYAGFYDALYRDKDYAAEVDFLERTLERFGSGTVKSILDLGCGTGGHALPLAARGYEVAGVDRSAEMVSRARRKAGCAGLAVDFNVGDVRDVDLGRTFDAVICMFAVICYQCSNDDLLAAMRTARRHLARGGLFVFDGWFGPAVLVQRPEQRTQIVELEDGERIERYADPQLDVASHTVEVRYGLARKSATGVILEESHETHRVRFLFPQEIARFLDQAGFELAAIGPFMDFDSPLTDSDWNVSVAARAV